MSAKVGGRSTAQWLPVLVFLGFVVGAAVDTDATAAKIPVAASVAAGDASPIALSVEAVPPAGAAQAESAPQPIVIASLAAQTPPSSNMLAAPVTAAVPPTSIAPLISTAPGPKPTRVFTINEVMASYANGAVHDKLQENTKLASIDPAAIPDIAMRDKSEEPFGFFAFTAPDGLVWFKWRKVAEDIRTAEPELMGCLDDRVACTPAAARFVAIVKEAHEHQGRVRLNFVNQRVNNAIRYTSDMSQWGAPDEWSAPLAGGKGSFETGLGDCEDYAIAKYVALRAAGVPAKQLRLLLVHDNIARLDHAVLAANEDGHWYVLDNRWTAAVADSDVRRFTPLFALDDQGVKLLAMPYAARVEPKIEAMSEAVKRHKDEARIETRPEPIGSALQKFHAADQTPQSSGIGALGLRPSIL